MALCRMGLNQVYGPAGKAGGKHPFHCPGQAPPKVQAGSPPRVCGKDHLLLTLSDQVIEPIDPLIHVFEPLSQFSPLGINGRSQFSPLDINGCSQFSPLSINGRSQFSSLGANSRSQFSSLGINSVIKVEEAHGSQTDEGNDETDGGNDKADQNPVFFHGRRRWPSRGNGLLGDVRGACGGSHGSYALWV